MNACILIKTVFQKNVLFQSEIVETAFNDLTFIMSRKYNKTHFFFFLFECFRNKSCQKLYLNKLN